MARSKIVRKKSAGTTPHTKQKMNGVCYFLFLFFFSTALSLFMTERYIGYLAQRYNRIKVFLHNFICISTVVDVQQQQQTVDERVDGEKGRTKKKNYIKTIYLVERITFTFFSSIHMKNDSIHCKRCTLIMPTNVSMLFALSKSSELFCLTNFNLIPE